MILFSRSIYVKCKYIKCNFGYFNISFNISIKRNKKKEQINKNKNIKQLNQFVSFLTHHTKKKLIWLRALLSKKNKEIYKDYKLL